MRKDPTEFRLRFARWKDGELVYEAGRIIEKSDNTSVQRLEPILPIKRNFIAEAQLKHAAEAITTDTRSSYQRQQSLKEALKAYQLYLELKLYEQGMKNLNAFMATLSPSTYAEIATGENLGTGGRLAVDAIAFGLPGMMRSSGTFIGKQVLKNFIKRFPLTKPKIGINVPSNDIKLLENKSVAQLPPEATYTGRIPKRKIDLETLKQHYKDRSLLLDVANNPNDYTFQEIAQAIQAEQIAKNNIGVLPQTLESSGKTIYLGGQSFRDHLKHNINPVLRHDGFKGVPLDASPEEAMLYVREKYGELNTFARGVVDPRALHQHDLYGKVKDVLKSRLGKEPTHEEIMDYIAVTPNRGTTGHGSIGREHGEYVLYTSNGYDLATGYALRGDRPTNVIPDLRGVYELRLPEQIPNENTSDSRFSQIGNYILNNRFALLNRGHHIEKDLYSEYGLPYLLATGKSLPMHSIDYDEGLRKYFLVNRKDQLGVFFDSVNEQSEQINKLLLNLNSTFRLPYIRFSTMRKNPQIVDKQTRLQRIINTELFKWRRSSMSYPEDAAPFLLEQAIKSIKKAVKEFNATYKPKKFNPTVQKTENLLKQDLENAIGETPVGGYLKHKEAHNVFTTEGYNRRLTVNDERYKFLNNTVNKDATLQHYVFYNTDGHSPLIIKRRVPFGEWKDLRNRGSSHYGSYSPGLSRRMSLIILPMVVSDQLYNIYKNSNKNTENELRNK